MERVSLGRRSGGFTIVELMIVIAIIGVLAAIAVPAFDDLIKNNRRTTVVNEVLASFMLARAEAAKRGQPVSVCGTTSVGGISCTGGTSWSYGFMVFLDGGPPPAGAVAGDGAIADTTHRMKNYVNDYPDIRLTTATLGAGHVTLQPFNQPGTTGSVTICDKRGASKARAVCIATNGRARVSETACGGGAIVCP